MAGKAQTYRGRRGQYGRRVKVDDEKEATHTDVSTNLANGSSEAVHLTTDGGRPGLRGEETCMRGWE
jgi:hypothetical protein